MTSEFRLQQYISINVLLAGIFELTLSRSIGMVYTLHRPGAHTLEELIDGCNAEPGWTPEWIIDD
jgi:hypothetical protein